tara:strand:+ start:45 stop:374 length:330 start_codon:yes stop_codon:yes gene_type:complete
MKLCFELNTTFIKKPIYLSIDENDSMCELCEKILFEIEGQSNLTRNEIIDIFLQDEKTTLSVLNCFDTLNNFIFNNENYFSKLNNSHYRNIHKIYVMDKPHFEKIRKAY